MPVSASISPRSRCPHRIGQRRLEQIAAIGELRDRLEGVGIDDDQVVLVDFVSPCLEGRCSLDHDRCRRPLRDRVVGRPLPDPSKRQHRPWTGPPERACSGRCHRRHAQCERACHPYEPGRRHVAVHPWIVRSSGRPARLFDRVTLGHRGEMMVGVQRFGAVGRL
jgi:hypothetical protein